MIIYEGIGGIFVACLIVLGMFKAIELWRGRKANADATAITDATDETTGGTPDAH